MAGASLAESQTRIQSITSSMAFRPAPTKHLFHSLLLPVGLCVLVLVAGCRREPTPAPAPAAPAEVPGPALAPPQPGQAPPPIVSTIESKDTAYTQEMVQTLNDFLGDYIKQHKRVPRVDGCQSGVCFSSRALQLLGDTHGMGCGLDVCWSGSDELSLDHQRASTKIYGLSAGHPWILPKTGMDSSPRIPSCQTV